MQEAQGVFCAEGIPGLWWFGSATPLGLKCCTRGCCRAMEVRPYALCVLRCALLPDMLLLPLMMADSSAGATQMGMKEPWVRSTAILGADGVQVGETRPGGAHGRQHCGHPPG